MWRIDICEQTGDPCFINNLTKVVRYEPPIGYVMSEKQKEQWQQLKEICKEKVDINADNTVNISDWQEVPDEENYFKVNQIIEEPEEEEKEKEENKFKRPLSNVYREGGTTQRNFETEGKIVQKTWKESLEDKIKNNEINANEVMETVISHQLMLCKNLKEKNDTLKNLIKGDIEIRQTAEEFNRKDNF